MVKKSGLLKKGDKIKMCGGGYEGANGTILKKGKFMGYDVFLEGLPSTFVKWKMRDGKTIKKKLPSYGVYQNLPTKWICK